MTGIAQYRAYRVMIVLFRSLWFLGDIVLQCAQDLGKESKDVSFTDFGDWFFGLDKDARRVKFKFAVFSLLKCVNQGLKKLKARVMFDIIYFCILLCKASNYKW